MAWSKPAATLAVGAVVTGGLVGWFVADPPPQTEPSVPGDHAPAIEAPAPIAPSLLAQDRTSAEPGLPAPVAAGEVLDLCGVGRMPLPVGTPSEPPPAWQPLPTPLGAPAMAAAQAMVMARLAAGNDRQRTAALMMRLPLAEDAAERSELAAQIAAIERAARDPAISAWTMSICEVDGAACDADTARRWVDSERDNAAAWIALARRKLAAAEVIDAGMAQVTRHDVHYGALVATVRKAWPADEAPYLQLPVLLHALGVDGMVAMNLMQATYNYCKPPPTDSLRVASCHALAESMVQRGDTLLSHKLGAAIGAQLGWSSERRAALNAESKALLAAGPRIDGGSQPYSCESIERVRGWIDALGQSGEMASARAALKAPG